MERTTLKEISENVVQIAKSNHREDANEKVLKYLARTLLMSEDYGISVCETVRKMRDERS